MKTSLIIGLGALLLSSTATLAQEEKVLNLFNWSDYRADDTLDNFTKETGITVVESNYDSNEMLEGKLVAGSSGYDVVVPSGYFLQHQIPLGIYQKLDKSKLPNLKNTDPAVMKATEAFDPGNQYAVDYMRYSTGLGFNVDAVKKRLPDVPIDSWDLLFKPEYAAKLQDCGITILDSPADVLPVALIYLGLDPNSENADDLKKAEDLMTGIKQYVRKYDSSGYIDDLANGDACLSLGYSGDVYIAKDRASKAGKGVNVGYVIPKEGSYASYDMLAIPSDAPHPENALAFINYLMEPKVIADASNAVFYANGNAAATQYVDPAIANDPQIYPPPDVQAKLAALKTHSPDFTRLMTRTWTRIKTGQ